MKRLCGIAILLLVSGVARAEPIPRLWIQALPQDAGEKALREALAKTAFQGPAGTAQALVAVADAHPGMPVAGLAHLGAGLALLDAGQAAEAAVLLRLPDVAQTGLSDRALLALGTAQEAAGDQATAAVTYLQAADALPGSSATCTALVHAGEALSKTLQHEKAASAFDRASQSCPGQEPKALLREAESLEAAHKSRAAAEAYDRLDRDFPASAEAIHSESHRLALASFLTPEKPDIQRDRDMKKGLALFDASKFVEAAAAFRAAVRGGLQGADVDLAHARLGRALLNVGRPREGHTELALVKPESESGPEAAYYLARLKFQLTKAPETLEAVAGKYPGSPFAEEALVTLANHFQKDALDAGALPYYEKIVSGFPDGHYIQRASWRVAWARYRKGRFEEAAQLLERTAQTHPSAWTSPGFLYWAARSHLALAQVDRARQLLEDTVDRFKYTYHGLKAQQALSRLPPVASRAAALRALDGEPVRPELSETTVSRVRALLLLDRFDMALEEISTAPPSPARDATLGWIDWKLGHLRPAINEMRHAYPEWLGQGGDLLPEDVWKILYPMQFRESLEARSASESVDAALVAAVICQESTFDQGAVSHAGARGLMQVMPRTGMLLARSLGHPWRSQSLFNPDTSLEFGIHYLRQMLDLFSGRTEMALAAYNAGPERVEAWNALRPDQSPEEFIESIPFSETRNYVLTILGSQEQYRRIYALPPGPDRAERERARDDPVSFRIGDFKRQIDPALLPKQGKDMRHDGRAPDQLRPTSVARGFMKHAEGSALIEVGDTKVICTVSVEERVPPFLKGKGEGWITSEYGMLPRSTSTRMQRENTRGGASGRTHEIQRLIGRSLRAIVDLRALGERTLFVDCDVIQADGGTRTASITGAFVALVDALRHLKKQGAFEDLPLLDFVAAVSVGKVKGRLLLDLDYEEDSNAEVDMNIVKTGRGRFVEVQGTAEETPFSEDELQGLLGLAAKGIEEAIGLQRKALGDVTLKTPKA